MGLSIFRKPYTVRMHGEQTVKRGYAFAPYADIIARLNVQPQAPDNFDGREEGDVSVKNLKAWGSLRLTASDELAGTPGDCLYYRGAWYECKSCVKWDHTFLNHYQSDFVIMPAESQFKPPGSAHEQKHMPLEPPKSPGVQP